MGFAFRRRLLTELVQVAEQKFYKNLAIPVAEHGGRAALHVLLMIGLVTTKGSGRGSQDEAPASEKLLIASFSSSLTGLGTPQGNSLVFGHLATFSGTFVYCYDSDPVADNLV